mmetsp:Transcript_12146/g.32596  ORF Transcript_12146/g.32596 Transcript_12146/m.32596 type:complete len:235 (-) Transcript_12146:227-931(-)
MQAGTDTLLAHVLARRSNRQTLNARALAVERCQPSCRSDSGVRPGSCKRGVMRRWTQTCLRAPSMCAREIFSPDLEQTSLWSLGVGMSSVELLSAYCHSMRGLATQSRQAFQLVLVLGSLDSLAQVTVCFRPSGGTTLGGYAADATCLIARAHSRDVPLRFDGPLRPASCGCLRLARLAPSVAGGLLERQGQNKWGRMEIEPKLSRRSCGCGAKSRELAGERPVAGRSVRVSTA